MAKTKIYLELKDLDPNGDYTCGICPVFKENPSEYISGYSNCKYRMIGKGEGISIVNKNTKAICFNLPKLIRMAKGEIKNE